MAETQRATELNATFSVIMSDYKRLEISEVIYECVSRTELQDMDRQRVEMMLYICDSMRDHDFRTEINTHQPLQSTGCDCVKIRNSRAAPVCLVLLCVLLLTAVIVLCVHIHTKSTNYTEERDQLLITIKAFKTEKDQIKIKNQNLTNEMTVLLSLLKSYYGLLIHLHEKDGWIYFQSSFYYISSEKKNWSESRRDCTERGADLIIINNKEEQDFVKKMSDGALVWIGLTNSDEEGTWKWVDDTNMTSGFWRSGESNGQMDTGQNCVLTYTPGWADYPCNYHFKWICEKTIKTSH